MILLIIFLSTGANSFPISFNFFEFTQGQHNVLVVVTDSAGESKSYLYNFIGRTPEGE